MKETPIRRLQHAVDARLRWSPHGSMRWATIGLVAGLVAGFAACSSDNEGSGGAAASGSGSATVGSGAASGTGASGSSGGSGGSGGGDCIDYMPPMHGGGPVQVAGSCPTTTACGGMLEGEWDLNGGCVPAGNLYQPILSVCSTALINPSSATISGTVTFDGTTMTEQGSVSVSATLTAPNNCTFCACAAFEANLQSAGVNASCNPVCNGGDCFCTVDLWMSLSDSDSYTTNGTTTITTAGGRTFDYCVDPMGLTLGETGSADGSVLKLERAPAPPDFEVCDGIDNDANGVADDDPKDCHAPCSEVGVCAGNSMQSCGGTMGWLCEYTVSAYEPDEVTCDQLDNDCDGQVDDGPDCGPEVCDGIDNDGDGTADDSPTDTPPCDTQGVCANATATCLGAAGWQCDYGPTYEATEATCDGLDNDCNGAVDEPAMCHPIDNAPCSAYDFSKAGGPYAGYFWIAAHGGHSCNTACGLIGKTCTTAGSAILTDLASMHAAFAAAGYAVGTSNAFDRQWCADGIEISPSGYLHDDYSEIQTGYYDTTATECSLACSSVSTLNPNGTPTYHYLCSCL